MNVLLGSESGVGDGNVFRIADKVKNDIWLVLARENHSDHLCVWGGGGVKVMARVVAAIAAWLEGFCSRALLPY